MFARLKPATLGDNAFFYKDLTQWLRSGAFVALFFALLLAGEAATASVALSEAIPRGPALLFRVKVILFCYLILVAARGHLLAFRELRSSTFDFYVLTGITQHQFPKAQWLSMMCQFLFGLFCLMPYMLAAYMMGGMDFLRIVAALLAFCLWAAPVFLLALMTAYRQAAPRRFASFMTTMGHLFVLFSVSPFLMAVIALIVMILKRAKVSFAEGLIAGLLKGIFILDPYTLAGCAALVLFYCGLIRLLFEYCAMFLVEFAPALTDLWTLKRRRAYATPVAPKPAVTP